MYKKLAIAVSMTLLSGCASSSKTFAPDGREAYSLDCSGLARSWGMCLSKAGDICGPKGYDVLTAAGDRGMLATVNQYQGYASSTISRNLLISCKK